MYKRQKVAVVVTSPINHATPASYLSHNESRKNYNAIADSYLDERIGAKPKMDVIFGGGKKYFIREDRNLVNEFIQDGFQYIDSYEQLNTLQENKPVIGLFADDGLPLAIDDEDNYRLSSMTKVAINQLESDLGFFMLIEASQVDWGGHNNDIAAIMSEMDDLSKTIEYLEKYVISHPDTLVVITADHSTGGLALGADGLYAWRPDILRAMKMSSLAIAKALASEKVSKAASNKLFNFELSSEEISLLKASKEKAGSDSNSTVKSLSLIHI